MNRKSSSRAQVKGVVQFCSSDTINIYNFKQIYDVLFRKKTWHKEALVSSSQCNVAFKFKLLTYASTQLQVLLNHHHHKV